VTQQLEDFDESTVPQLQTVSVTPTQYQLPVFFGNALEAKDAETVMYALFGTGLALLLALIATLCALRIERTKKERRRKSIYDMRENGVDNLSMDKTDKSRL